MERAIRALLVIAILAFIVPFGLPASAQSTTVSLSLLSQSPWSARYGDPRFRISIVATNFGTIPLGHLSVGISIGAHYETVVGYESSLVEGPTNTVFQRVQPEDGRLEPNTSTTLFASVDLSAANGIDQTDNQVYPARVDVRSNGSVLASLTTPVLYFIRRPEAPMLLSSWIELAPTIAFGSDGRLLDTAFPDALRPQGQLGAPIAALEGALAGLRPGRAFPMGLVVEPALVEQAQRAAGGYTLTDGTVVPKGADGPLRAAGFLDSLSHVMDGPGVRTVATPFAGPTIPSMVASGLAHDLATQRSLGLATLQSLTGTALQTDVARPPSGSLSDDAIGWLADAGAGTILADADTVDRPMQSDGTNPAPTATVSAPDGSPMTLVLPDPGIEGLLGRSDLVEDPVRAAQAVLGELAVIWKEAPVPEAPHVRGIALALPSTLPPGMWAPMLARLQGTPFLRLTDAGAFATSVNPQGDPTVLRSPDASAFPASYTEQIREQQHRVATYRSMLTQASPVPDELTRDIYYAESARYVTDWEAGTSWLNAVAATTQQAFDSVKPQVGQGFTFTSGEGTIPILMGDPGLIPLRVTVELQSSQFDFPDGSQREVILERPDQVVSFRVIAKAAGQNPILVDVIAPNGDEIGDPQAIVVRSTAVNHIALLVTLAAAGVLALLYSRRWWFRRTKVSS
ncbi:MAG: hypothetical protein E6G37_00565 [Actinobacteria bacterium]|nr:MAG: hypothetical protein E6G37_00565 [Actinomycetota bacterium]TMM24210.1 MAG: hypothetical protein E6F95_04955 [Actinomycetota bacterium]